MRESFSLGPTPCGESCEQLGPDYNPVKARQECRAFIAQLIRLHGEPPFGARLRGSSNPHDFGSYLEVEVVFDDDEPDAAAYAYKLEAKTPEGWDHAAIEELRAAAATATRGGA